MPPLQALNIQFMKYLKYLQSKGYVGKVEKLELEDLQGVSGLKALRAEVIYKKDFSEDAGSVKEFLKKHLDDPKIKAKIDEVKDIDHIEYDWNLNRPENFN